VSFLPSSNDLLLFVSTAVILLLIPGPAVLYVLTRSVEQGRKAGLASCSGIATGSLVHVLAATLGLSALLLSSAVAYSAVKFFALGMIFTALGLISDSAWALTAGSAAGWLRSGPLFATSATSPGRYI
jgi:threonine/homoserine/homoserine lactone efflux protein